MTLGAMNIVLQPLVLDIRTEWRVEPWPMRKRRRNWRVVRYRIERPACWQAGNTLYMHPDLFEMLKEPSK